MTASARNQGFNLEAMGRGQANSVATGKISPGTLPFDEGVALTLRRWDMLNGVKRLAIGISGGADSLALLEVLHKLVGDDIELIPLHIHQHPQSQDAASLTGYVSDRFQLESKVVEADTSERVRKVLARGKSPCRACAPIRARHLGYAAKRYEVDAVALGHHLDDAAATLLMNMFHRGEMDTMRPIAKRRTLPGVPLLRPLLFSTEQEVKAASPVAPTGLFDCGVCSLHAQERARATKFVGEMFGLHVPAARHVASLVEMLAKAA